MARGRIIVAAPPSLCRDGAGILHVGVLRWLLPPGATEEGGLAMEVPATPMMTVIAKATFSFAGDEGAAGSLPFATEPLALSFDLPSELDGAAEGETAYPSDFVPMKPAVEVLLHGHAYADRQSRFIEASLTIRPPADDAHADSEALTRSFAVESAAPATRAPLLARAIRAGAGDLPSEPVGPRPSRELLVLHPEGFPFAEYKVGPGAQQMGEAPLGWSLSLRGLSPRSQGAERTIRIPNVTPLAWVDAGARRGEPLEMWCDTVWIDTDRELLVLVFRGVLEIDAVDDDGVERIVLGLSVDGRAPSLGDVRRDLVCGVFEPAVEIADFDEEEPSAQGAEEAALLQYELWEEAVVPTISLEAYAGAAAAVAESAPEGAEGRQRALAARGLDERSFLREERAWLMKMGDAAMAGDTALAERYGELFVAAQDALARPGEGDEHVEEYALLKVEMDDADDPGRLLAEREMTFAAWMRMDRRWQRRAAEDAALRGDIERRQRAYRARKEG